MWQLALLKLNMMEIMFKSLKVKVEEDKVWGMFTYLRLDVNSYAYVLNILHQM